MEFHVREWRRIYDKVRSLGQKLRDSHPTYDENDNLIEAIKPIALEEQQQIEKTIKTLTQENDEYLDCCKMKPYDPAWHYNKNDPSTWLSDASFNFKIRVKPISKRIKIVFKNKLN
jgi:hypothetical protein